MTQMIQAPANGNGAKASPLSIMAAKFSIEPARLLDVLKGTVIRATDKYTPTNEEIAAFTIVAKQYGLNPFTREIHAFADRFKGIVPIVGIDGWSRIVNSHPQFDGCEFESQEDKDGKPIAITCAMYVKERSRPVKVTERFSECQRPTDPWRQMPWRMLRHKAFMQAARLAFSISGIFDEDEAKDVVQFVESHAVDPAPQPKERKADRITRRIAETRQADADVDPLDGGDDEPQPPAGASGPVAPPSAPPVSKAAEPAPTKEREAAAPVATTAPAQADEPYDLNRLAALKVDELEKLLRETSIGHGVSMGAFKGGLFKYVTACGYEQLGHLDADERLRLYRAVSANAFDYAKGRVTS